MNDGNPELPARAFFDRNRYVRVAVTIKISFQIRRVSSERRDHTFFQLTRSLGPFLSVSGTSRIAPGDGGLFWIRLRDRFCVYIDLIGLHVRM
jgi:hypothetical protein